MLLPSRLRTHDRQLALAPHRSFPSLPPHVVRNGQIDRHETVHPSFSVRSPHNSRVRGRDMFREQSTIAKGFRYGRVYILALRLALLSDRGDRGRWFGSMVGASVRRVLYL